MGKTLKILSLLVLTIAFVMGGAVDSEAKKKKQKKIPKSPKYVGAVKCNGSCHDAYYSYNFV